MVAQRHAQVSALVKQLGAYLDAGRVRNANIIKQYAIVLGRQRPDVARLTRELAREGYNLHVRRLPRARIRTRACQSRGRSC